MESQALFWQPENEFKNVEILKNKTRLRVLHLTNRPEGTACQMIMVLPCQIQSPYSALLELSGQRRWLSPSTFAVHLLSTHLCLTPSLSPRLLRMRAEATEGLKSPGLSLLSGGVERRVHQSRRSLTDSRARSKLSSGLYGCLVVV